MHILPFELIINIVITEVQLISYHYHDYICTSSEANNCVSKRDTSVALANLVCLQRNTKLTEVPVCFLGIHLANHTLRHNEESDQSDLCC